MASRERKRGQRRKRKERGSQRREEEARRRSERAARSEARNQEARESLVPLAAGERPTAVTVGAVISSLLALSSIAGYAIGLEVSGDRAPVLSVAVTVALMSVMALGLWRCRYWAVLGFQTLLLIVIIATALGLVGATDVTRAVANVLLLAGAGFFFYRMIKAMARIQMPQRR